MSDGTTARDQMIEAMARAHHDSDADGWLWEQLTEPLRVKYRKRMASAFAVLLDATAEEWAVLKGGEQVGWRDAGGPLWPVGVEPYDDSRPVYVFRPDPTSEDQ